MPGSACWLFLTSSSKVHRKGEERGRGKELRRARGLKAAPSTATWTHCPGPLRCMIAALCQLKHREERGATARDNEQVAPGFWLSLSSKGAQELDIVSAPFYSIPFAAKHVLQSLWDLSSPTRDLTRAPCVGSLAS